MSLNDIFAKYETKISEFASDLEMFATGGYLAEGEAENWFEPLDASRIPAVQEALMNYLKVALANPVDPLLASTDILNLYKRLDEINDQDMIPVVEQEELEDIEGMLRSLYEDLEMPEEDIATLPTYEDYVDTLDED